MEEEPRLSASREPSRTTQKEKSIYSRRQKNSSKRRLPMAQARKRSSRSLQKKADRISNDAAHSGYVPQNRGHLSPIFQQISPPMKEAVNTSARETDRTLPWQYANGSSRASGYTSNRVKESSHPETASSNRGNAICRYRLRLSEVSKPQAYREIVRRHG